jgi:hypothetical protein
VRREWAAAGLRPSQAPFGPLPKNAWSRTSIRTILLNPRIAGLSAFHEEIVGTGTWEPLVGEETWRAVPALLEDPSRKPPREHPAGRDRDAFDPATVQVCWRQQEG